MFSKIFSSKKSSQILIWVSAGIAGFGFIFFLVSWRYSKTSLLFPPSYPVYRLAKSVRKEIGTLEPSLSFYLGEEIHLELPNFQNEIDFFHFEPRPDCSHFSPYILQLKRSHSKRPVSYGEKIYLFYGERQGLEIAHEPGPFWLVLEDVCPPMCKIHISSPDESKISSKVIEFPVAFQKACPGCSIREHSAFLKLGQAKLWGPDQLLDDASSYRLEIQGESDTYLCGVEEGTILFYQDDIWMPLEIDDLLLAQDKPLARIIKKSDRSLEIEGWDETGEKHYTFSLFPISVPILNIKSEEWMSSIRMETQKKISCLLERQKMVLKVGDWLVKCSGKWKALKDEREVQDCYDRCDLELFVFDGIENRNGLKYIQGRLFHAMRTQCLPIEVPIRSPRHRETKRQSLTSHLRGEK